MECEDKKLGKVTEDYCKYQCPKHEQCNWEEENATAT